MAIYRPADDADLAAITTTTGDTVLLRAGATYTSASIPAGLVSPAGVTLGVTGTGAPPIITGGAVRSDWVYDAGNNVYSRTAYAGNTLGNVTEDGVPMKFVAWNTNIATTAAAMNAGQNLPYWSGSMTYDPAAFIVYIRPSSGTAAQHEYVVSESLYGITNSATNSGLVIDGIEFRSISRHGIVLFNKTNLAISNCAFNVIGGLKPSSLWLGNGIEISKGCWGVEVTDCSFTDIFDSAVTSQLYESTPAVIGSHLWADLTAARVGLHVVEISCQTSTGQVIRDVEIARIASTDHGAGWAGDRSGAVVCNLTQGGTSQVTRSFARNVIGTNQRRLYLGYQHNGVCGIEDSIGNGSRSQAPRSDQGAGGPQTDLYRNVSDNLGAPSGSPWVASSANMAATFRGLVL